MQAAAAVVFPARCAVCGTGSAALCGTCWSRLRPAPELPPPAGVDWWGALLAYEGASRTLVTRLKYRNERGALAWLAAGMADLVRASTAGGASDEVTWIPTSSRRRRQRGFDQAELLARAVARELGLPCRSRLVRTPGPAQTGRSRSERLLGPTFSTTGAPRPPAAVLVVDDVLTTGATVRSAATTLRSAGALHINVAVVATTLLKKLPDRADP